MTKKKTNWTKIRNDYISSSISTEKLAEKYNVSYSAVKEHCRKENWVEKKKRFETKVDEKIVEKNLEKVCTKFDKINNSHIKICSEVRELVDLLIEELKESALERREGKTKKSKNTSYALDYLMSAVKKLQQVERTANDMDLKDRNDTTDTIEPTVNIIQGLDESKI